MKGTPKSVVIIPMGISAGAAILLAIASDKTTIIPPKSEDIKIRLLVVFSPKNELRASLIFMHSKKLLTLSIPCTASSLRFFDFSATLKSRSFSNGESCSSIVSGVGWTGGSNSGERIKIIIIFL